MKKTVKVGWVPKNSKTKTLLEWKCSDWDNYYFLETYENIYLKKRDCPNEVGVKKVRVTIEEIE